MQSTTGRGNDSIQLRRFSSRAEGPTISPRVSPSTFTVSLPPIEPTSFTPAPSIPELATPAAGEDHEHDVESPLAFSALPSVDSGKQAWLFLVAATGIEALVWGLPFSIGILHEYWTSTLFEGRGESTITLAATLQTGVLYMSAGAFGPVFTAFPRWQRSLQVMGLVAGAVSMISCAFVKEPWHLIVTIGIFYPLSGALYLPCATLLFEWFHARRGLASGIMYAGTGAGGSVFPFIVSGLLGAFGYKITMISLGVAFSIIGGIALLAIKRRIPLARNDQTNERRRSQLDWSFMGQKLMLAGTMTILLTSLGNFVPSLWLPTFAKELSVTKPNGTALIAIMNAASVPGLALWGYLSDRLPIAMVVTTNCVGAALSCLLLWGFGTSDTTLVFFVLSFGLLGLSFSALWTKLISIISRDEPSTPALVFSIFTFARGIGNITSGPISDALLKSNLLKGATAAYGFRNYGILLIYTGATILGGGITGTMFHSAK